MARAVPSWLRPLTIAAAALLLLACFSGEVHDTDTFWHLATGRYLAQTHHLPVPDPFSWGTYLGKLSYPGEEHTRYFNLTHEWLAQIWFYFLYAVGGYPAMVLARAILLSLVAAAAGWLVWRRTLHFHLALAAPLLFLGVQYRDPVSDRPLLLTLVFLMATVLILETRRYLWALPPLFVLWSNSHGAWIMGWIVLGGFCLEDLWIRRPAKAVPQSRTVWFGSAAALLATGINPNGFRAIQVLFLYQQSALQSQLIEWTPPALWPPEEMFTIVLWSAAALLLWARSKARPADVIIYLLFAIAAARASRNIVFVALAGAWVIGSSFPWRRAMPAIAEYAIAAALVFACVAQIARGHAFELRAAEWRLPSGPAQFLAEHHVTGRMFNTYGDGGYLIWKLWPQQKVMTDGRALNETVYADNTRILNYELEPLDRYGIEVIVAEPFEYYTGRPWWLPINFATRRQDEWKLVFHDATGIVFMRRPPEGVAPIYPPKALASFEQQCEIHLAHDPDYPGCAAGLARVFAGINDLPHAKKWGTIYLEYERHPDPKDVQALQQLISSAP